MNKQRFQKFCDILISIRVITAALCLMTACGFLFISDGGFSRESVLRAFGTIAIPFNLCLVLIGLGLLFGLSRYSNDLGRGIPRQEWLILRRLRKCMDLSCCCAALRGEIAKERRMQRTRNGISAGLTFIIGCILLVYLLSGDRFPRDNSNAAIGEFLGILIPGLIILWGWILVSEGKYTESRRREIALLKSVSSSKTSAKISRRKHLSTLRFFIFAAAVALFTLGLCTGGAADVLTKAINICTECIGLG